jgi:hypothetical protein
MYIVTRYIDGKLTTYTVDNWNHVGVQLALGRITFEGGTGWEKVA